MGAMKVWDGSSWQSIAPFSERASVYVGPSQPAGTSYAGDMWWDTDDPPPGTPGQELAYTQITASVAINASVEASGDTVVTAPAVTFDGTTVVNVEFYSDNLYTSTTAGSWVRLALFQDGAPIGWIAQVNTPAAGYSSAPVMARRRLTPTAGLHTYSIRGWASAAGGACCAGTGGAGNHLPAYIRIMRA